MYIYGMSYRRSDLAAWIEDHTFPAMICLAQLYMFPNSENRRHWATELFATFHSMRVLRGTSRVPSSRFIFENSWGIDEKYFKDACNAAEDKELELDVREDFSYDAVRELMRSYFEWIASELSVHRAITLSDVFNELDVLGV